MAEKKSQGKDLWLLCITQNLFPVFQILKFQTGENLTAWNGQLYHYILPQGKYHCSLLPSFLPSH